jgi:hypothetical protein
MALDIPGSRKNTKLNKRPLVFIDELVANAIDSYLIRKNRDSAFKDSLAVELSVEFYYEDPSKTKLNLKIQCSDNGAGFGDKEVNAFITKDTSYKDTLRIPGLGKCRGLGRIQYLHYFQRIHIESVWLEGKGKLLRELAIDTNEMREIDAKLFVTKELPGGQISTKITLDALKPEILRTIFAEKVLIEEFSIESVRQHVMVNFLPQFVGLKESLGDFVITFKLKHHNEEESARLTRSDLPPLTKKTTVDVLHADIDETASAKSEKFTLSHYKLDGRVFKLRSNLVALCARSATVKSITHRYLTTKAHENNDIDGFYHLIFIESPYLDDHVNGTREDFEIPEKKPRQKSLFGDLPVSLEQIYEKIDPFIDNAIAPPDWKKNEIVEAATQKYGITPEMIKETGIKIRTGNTEEDVVTRVLAEYQKRAIGATSAIVDLKTEIEKTDPTTEQFRKQVTQLAWRYTSSLSDIDKLNLSQLVVRRAAILEVLRLAIGKALPAQNAPSPKRRDEEFIHNILFPKGKDSNEIKEHDIWLLNEEYQYFDYIASDKALSTITAQGLPLFDATIDPELEKLLDRIYKKDAANRRRPDIAIFSNEGTAIIIELKAPGVSLDDHVADLIEYSNLLALKSRGKLLRFYGYLLGDTVLESRLGGSYTAFPDGHGWFGTQPLRDFGIRPPAPIGSLYSEILFYKDIVDRASKRLEVYKKRIGLEFR